MLIFFNLHRTYPLCIYSLDSFSLFSLTSIYALTLWIITAEPFLKGLTFLLKRDNFPSCCGNFSGFNSLKSTLFFLFRPNVKEPGGAALLDIRNQAIIVEYLLKNVEIFFDKNLASAAIAFYPETEEITVPATNLGMQY